MCQNLTADAATAVTLAALRGTVRHCVVLAALRGTAWHCAVLVAPRSAGRQEPGCLEPGDHGVAEVARTVTPSRCSCWRRSHR